MTPSPVPWVSDARWQRLSDACRHADAMVAYGASKKPPRWTERKEDR